MKIEMKQASLSLGLAFAAWHFTWVVLVALSGGWIIGYVLAVHHIGGVSAAALPLDVVNLAVGTVLAFVTGAVTGALFALIWNSLEKKK